MHLRVKPLVCLFLLFGLALTAHSQTFQTGDIFVATQDFDPVTPDGFRGAAQTGKVKWFRLNTTTGAFDLVKELDTTVSFGQPEGMGFDKAGNLYVTNFTDLPSTNIFSSGSISKFDNAGNLLGKLVTPDLTRFVHPESLVFDGAGNIFVGDADNRINPQIFPSPAILTKLDPNGITLATYQLATEDRGTDWIDLSKDQNTILYTSEGKRVLSFDTSTNIQNPDFAAGLPGDAAFALRIAPSGEVFVADSDEVVRLSSTGTILQTYFVPPCPACTPQSLFAINLDPDGLHLWTADIFGGPVSRVRIDTGVVDATIDTLLTPCCGTIGGVAVFGEHRAAGGTTVTTCSAFGAKVELRPSHHEYEVEGSCTLGKGNNGLNFVADDLTLTIGATSFTIPKNSLKANLSGSFSFEGNINKQELEVSVTPSNTIPGKFSFEFEGPGDPTGGVNPVPVTLTIGDDTGTAKAKVTVRLD